jgi:hypothetical protein
MREQLSRQLNLRGSCENIGLLIPQGGAEKEPGVPSTKMIGTIDADQQS